MAETNRERNETTMIAPTISDKSFESLLDFPKTIAEQFDQETREHAANTLIDALLASCENQTEKTKLCISLLGYDPR